MFKMRCLFFLGLCCFLACQPQDQVTHQKLDLQSLRLYGGSDEDIAHDVIETHDGGFALLGNTKSTDGDLTQKNLAVSDLVLMKFDAQAQWQWTQTYGGSDDDRGHGLVQLSDGGFAIVGYAMSSDGDATLNRGMHDNWVLRVDAEGTILWQKSFGFSGHDHAYHILATPDGGFLFNGFLDVTSSQGQGSTSKETPSSLRHGVGEFWVHKIDRQGQLEWRRYYGGTNNDRSYAAVHNSEGGYYIVGTSESNDVDVSQARGSYDIWVIKIDAQGQLLWEKSFGGSAYDAAHSVLMKGSVLYVLGNTFSENKDVSSPLGQSDFWLLALDKQGELLREYTFGGSAFDSGQDLDFDTQGRLWLVGYGQSDDGDFSTAFGENDIQLIQLNTKGLPRLSTTLGGRGQDFAHALISWQNKILAVGTTESSDGLFSANQGGKDIFVAIWDVVLE